MDRRHGGGRLLDLWGPEMEGCPEHSGRQASQRGSGEQLKQIIRSQQERRPGKGGGQEASSGRDSRGNSC
jgi:hypothetical protein